jgi:hypothetical protein
MKGDKNELPLPNLNLRKLSLYVADLWLVSERSTEWVKEPLIRRVWQVDFFSWCGGIVANWVISGILGDFLTTSPRATLVWRSVWTLFPIWLLATTSTLAYLYYRYLLSTGRDIRFKNLVIFWGTWVVLFSKLYEGLYFLSPRLYSYPNPLFVPQETLTSIGVFKYWELSLKFLLYSACTTVSVAVPGLSSSSATVSTLNLIEVLGFILLLALLVATFVGKAENKNR